MHTVLLLSTTLALSKLSTAIVIPRGDLSTLHPTITWGNCTADDPPRLQCGQMVVPVDYNNPNGESVTLGIARLKSTSTSSPPLGTLLIDLGGPGASSAGFLQLVAQQNQFFSDSLMSNYDIVGLDPRGVGISNPVKCDPNIWNERVTLFPTTEQEYDALVAHNKAFGESCAKLTGNLINHLDTAHVVEDFEMFRRAVSNGTNCGLNYLAFSYGTQIAIQYAEKYPENINRFILDGVVDHSLPEISTLVAESGTYEATLNQFFLWCSNTPECPLHGQDIAALFDAVVKMSPNHLSLLPRALPQLAASLAEAAQGDASALSNHLMATETHEIFSFLAVACQDWRHEAASFVDVLEKTRMGAALFPHTRGASQNYFAQASCIGWPAPTSNPQHVLDKNALKAPPILLVNALHDPETSIQWATSIHAQLPASVLLTRNGADHTTYLSVVNKESRNVEDTFLITGELPAQGTMLDS